MMLSDVGAFSKPHHSVPAGRRKLMAGMMVGDVGGSNPRHMSSILTDQDRKAAALPIEVFGEPVVRRKRLRAMNSSGGRQDTVICIVIVVLNDSQVGVPSF